MARKKPRAKENTIVVEERSPAELPQATSPSPLEPKQLSWWRLDHLYSITKLLVNFESADKTLAAVLGIVSNTLPLRSAVLIDEVDGQAQVLVWRAESLSEEGLQTVRAHATAAYAYLAGSGSVSQENVSFVPEQSVNLSLVKTSTGNQHFIVIPLVVHRTIYGVLQVECTTLFSEPDLAFVNAIANQFAIALDRHKASRREIAARAEAEAAERRMAFLAESRRRLASSLEYQSTWKNVAQLVISEIADICIIDIVESDRWSAERICLLSTTIKGQMTEPEATRALANVMSRVLGMGEPPVYPDSPVSGESSACLQGSKEISTRFAELVGPWACVPLLFEGFTIGTLTVARRRCAPIYGDMDLLVLHDLSSCLVLSFNRARLYRTAIEALSSRDDLLSIVAHDLKSPLAVIMGYTNMFLKTARQNQPLSCDLSQIGAIHRSAAQMNKLIEDLLSTASIEAKHFLIERQLNAVEPLVNDALERMQPLASAKKIELKSELSHYISPILVDRERLMQVFANLIGNAIKFSPKGSVIRVMAEESGRDVQFSVQDPGPGIADDQLVRIFDRFAQVQGIGGKGTGLGLFIAKGIVEAHGGRVWAERNPVAGSTFRFTLPSGGSEGTSTYLPGEKNDG